MESMDMAGPSRLSSFCRIWCAMFARSLAGTNTHPILHASVPSPPVPSPICPVPLS